MNYEDFLFPRELHATPTPLRRVLVIGSCLAEEYVRSFAWNHPDIGFDHILFNNAADLPDTPPQPLSDYDFLYLQVPLRSLLSDRIVRFGDFSGTLGRELAASAMDTLDAMLDAGLRYSREHGILTLVSTFIVPQREVSLSFADPLRRNSLNKLIEDLNDRLRERVGACVNAYIADAEELASSIGKNRFLDDWWHVYAHGAITFHNYAEGTEAPFWLNTPIPRIDALHDVNEHQFYALVWRQLESIYRCVRQIDQVKLVIFDLDNTLWRGQIAEHYGDGMEWPTADGWPEGLIEAIHHLRARGILVALCSRNDEGLVTRRWERAFPRGLLTLDDFVVRKINFKSKAHNVGEIMAEVGVTPKSVVFVDDNPVERDDVKGRFPQIRIIGDNQMHTRRILLWAPETQVAFVSDESARREEMVKKQVSREIERASVSRETFLANLHCEVTVFRIHSASDPSFSRALELLNKTNQFNTTGRRWPLPELLEFMKAGRLYAFSVKDKFVEYGLVGVILVHGRHFEQYVMSCRVLGMEVETSALQWIMADIGGVGDGFTARVVETDANMASRDVFARAGFSPSGPEGFAFAGAELPQTAPHLRFTAAALEAAPVA